MKTINIVGVAILGWLAVAYTDKASSIDVEEKNSSPAVSPLKSDCVCVSCDDCSCSEKDNCQECSIETKKEVAVKITANTFPRPRKPCPPGGPGRR